MMSLFSSFDSFMFCWPILMYFCPLVFMLSVHNKLNSSVSFISNLKFLDAFFYSLKPKTFSKVSLLLVISVILYVWFLNLSSVFSFNFALTSQFSVVMFFSLTVWLSFNLFSLRGNAKGYLAHLIPEGTPIFLTSLLFLIEIVSNLIRPITLTVRLVANILAGHLLMILLSKLVMLNGLMFFTYIFLNMVELFVALIQSYILSTMVILYFSEVH